MYIHLLALREGDEVFFAFDSHGDDAKGNRLVYGDKGKVTKVVSFGPCRHAWVKFPRNNNNVAFCAGTSILAKNDAVSGYFFNA